MEYSRWWQDDPDYGDGYRSQNEIYNPGWNSDLSPLG